MLLVRSACRFVVRPGPATAHGAPQPRLPISPAPRPGPSNPSGTLHTGGGGGFALHEAFRGRVAGVSDPHVVQIPPIGGGDAATHSDIVPKVQTTSAKIGDNGLLRARWSTFWAHRCLSWRAARTRTPEHAREPLDAHVNPSTCTWAGLPTHISSGSRAGYKAHVQANRAHVRVTGPTCAGCVHRNRSGA